MLATERTGTGGSEMWSRARKGSEAPLPSLRNLLRRLSERPILKRGSLRLALELTHGGVKALDRARLCGLSRRIDHTVDERAFVCPGTGTSTGEELVSMLQSSGTGPAAHGHAAAHWHGWPRPQYANIDPVQRQHCANTVSAGSRRKWKAQATASWAHAFAQGNA